MSRKKKVKKISFSPQKVVLVILMAAIVFVFALILMRINKENKTKEPSTQEVGQAKNLEVETKELKQVPDSFPKDFPIYRNSEVDSAFVAEGEEVNAQSVIWTTEDSFNSVVSFYRSNLTSKSWDYEETLNEEDSFLFSFEKDEIFGFAGIGETGEGITVISVTIGAKFDAPSM